jgi:flavin-binding protein dodecin
VLAGEAQHVTSQIEVFGAPPSSAQLQALQEAVDRVQQGLDRLQTGLDSWTEEIVEII